MERCTKGEHQLHYLLKKGAAGSQVKLDLAHSRSPPRLYNVDFSIKAPSVFPDGFLLAHATC